MILGFGDVFNSTAKAQSMKEIIDKLKFIKIKNFCSERYCQANKKVSHRLGKIFAKYRSDKELLSKIYGDS